MRALATAGLAGLAGERSGSAGASCAAGGSSAATCAGSSSSASGRPSSPGSNAAMLHQEPGCFVCESPLHMWGLEGAGHARADDAVRWSLPGTSQSLCCAWALAYAPERLGQG